MHWFHRIKKCGVAILTALICTLCFINYAISTNAYTFSADVTLNSKAAILYSVDDEQVVYEKNADQTQSPGHLAQIMTAILVLEQCENLDSTKITADDSLYTVLYYYDEVDDVRYADISGGDTLTVRDYLYAMMLTSSCEAALILADYFGGSSGVDGFVEMMNDKAVELGCTNTTFQNPTGLYDIRQLTTARDMLTITNYALSLDDFAEIASTQTYTPSVSGSDSDWEWTHSNSMMDETSDYYYEGASGIKTGNLNLAGRSIITQATRNGSTYLVVLLNAPFTDDDDNLQYYHLEDASNLLDWAFTNLTYVTMLEDDEEIAEVEVENSDGNSYVLVRPESDCILLWNSEVDVSAVQKVITLEEDVMAPVKAGQELGYMELKFSGETITTIPLVAVSNVDRSFSKYNLYALKNFTNSPWFHYGLIAACIFTALYILLCIYAAYRAKRNVTPEDPIHLIPHAMDFQDRPQQNWRRSETVFYHGPDRTHENEGMHEMEMEKEREDEELTEASRR